MEPFHPLVTPAAGLSSEIETAFEQSANPVSILEPLWDTATASWDFRFARVNQAFHRTFWEGRESHLGRRMTEVCGAGLEESLAALREVHSTGTAREGEVFVAEIGQWFSVKILRADTGRLVLIHNDSTETEHQRKKAEEGKAYYRRLFELGTVKLVVSASTLRVLEANAHAQEFYGLPLDELLGKHLGELISDPHGQVPGTLAQVSSDEGVLFCDHRRWDQTLVPAEMHVCRSTVGEDWVYLLAVFGRPLVSSARSDGGQGPRPTAPCQPLDPLDQKLSAFRARYIGTFPYLDELIIQLAALGRIKPFLRGQRFISAGDPSTYSGISTDGFFRIYLMDARGGEVTLGFARPGQFLASYSAMVHRAPSEIFIEAMNDCEVVLLDARDFYGAMSQDERWFRVGFHLLQEELFRRERREISLLVASLRERYETFVQENQDLIPLLHNYQLASYLGVAPETLSRARKT